MRGKRILAAALTAALAVSLLVLPAGAAGSFSDVYDQTTALNADILRLMGVVSGVGSNKFSPEGSLTRAQFCTMVVKFLQRDGEARQYSTRTIFSDVTARHWARQYVNMAASIPVTEGSGDNAKTVYLVAGVGNGKFMPDNTISTAEAVTIVLRALGYSGKQAGSVWPQGYMDLAASIGLTDGVTAGTTSAISRAQAAQLFVNALQCKTAGGEVYYKTISGASVQENAIILAVNTATDDGSKTGAVRALTGSNARAYLPANGNGNVSALQGRRGDLVLNAQKEIVTFVPDNSATISITLDGAARAASIKAGGGKQYSIDKDTPVYIADAKENSGYKDSVFYESAYKDLVSGSRLTMYSENGKIVSIFASAAGAAVGTDAVVVMGAPSTAMFHKLTGGASNLTVIRGRETISLSGLKEYDVVTYDKGGNTLIASDLRVACCYEKADPSPRNPETIEALGGTKFEVMESAWDTCGSFKPGDSVVLLLTADGRVAGMTAASGAARSNAVGFVDGGKVSMFLPNGTEMKLSGSVSNENLNNRLVTISGTRSGISASRLAERRGPGDYQVSGRRLGSYKVASDVKIYEQVSGGVMAPVKAGELGGVTVAADRIASYHLNASNIVDVIVLNNVTGNAYEYGMMVSTSNSTTDRVEIDDKDGRKPTDKDWIPTYKEVTNHTTTWKLQRSTPVEFTDSAGYSGRSGDMVGVVPGKPMSDQATGSTIKAIIQLTEVKNVKSGDFFLSDDAWHITVGGRTYRVANDVECYRDLGGIRFDESNWLKDDTGAKRLTAIKAYSDNLTIYVDPVGQQVRIIKAN